MTSIALLSLRLVVNLELEPLDPPSWVRFVVRIFQGEPSSGGLDFGTCWDILEVAHP